MTDLLASGPITAPHGDSGRVRLLGPDRLRAALVEVLGAGRLAPTTAAADEAWLPVRVDGPQVLIGPVVLPSTPGCLTCAERRRDANRPDRLGWVALRREFGADPADTPNPLMTTVSVNMVAALVADEFERLTRTGEPARTRGAVLVLSLTTGLITRHTLMADPLCPDCADLPEDTPWSVMVRRPLSKPHPVVLRTGTLDGRWDDLLESYVDSEFGVISSIAAGSPYGIPTAVARLGAPRPDDTERHGYGRTGDFRSARLTAITEALERYGSLRPLGRRTAVLAPYEEVADRAVDPRDLGLYPDEWYDQPGFPFARFDPRRPLAWVWGYSFRRAEPVLVPESYAYYGARSRSQDPALAYECSNGCALGGCLEEAILHGLLEIAERDAFLMTWYARLPAPRLDLASGRDRHIPVLAEMVRLRWGYEVFAYSMMLEQRVPAVLVLAVDAHHRPGVPLHACSAAAHPDPERALRAALADAASVTGSRMERFDAERAARMVADPDEVREMSDHVLLGGHPDTAGRFSFLDTTGHPTLTLPDLAAQADWPRHHDLGDDLAELAGRYLGTGLDVIVVDTTTPEQRAGGFAGAKVIVPGTLPMTFGHRFRRTHGIPRLATVPRLLGYRSTDLPSEDVNPHPHPFP
ncbi:TOMM precursor leader peptide-binding protein [Saccharothrix longispora]|uniref:Ribosomal protein S12 methylthiotransferase accessory factor n=1 Tax=Saccharothrix longispora TaxID=33920 RepID=A0ABU1PV07_9PSEU|nr:TOMM precursor leader peptide-binding protein [Saccharothrix longispora]MDR6594485.1 ribosomal protein S12 methylthiotransferase accessory factor [Saccharothrix longispora]